MDETPLDIIIRPYIKGIDEDYVFTSWVQSSYYSHYPKFPNLYSIEKETKRSREFFKNKSRHINYILPMGDIKIACLKETPMVIIGYSVSFDKHLWYMYVKGDYRRQGVGTLLMPKDIETVSSSLTGIGKTIVTKKNLTLKGEHDGRNYEDRQAVQGI